MTAAHAHLPSIAVLVHAAARGTISSVVAALLALVVLLAPPRCARAQPTTGEEAPDAGVPVADEASDDEASDDEAGGEPDVAERTFPVEIRSRRAGADVTLVIGETRRELGPSPVSVDIPPGADGAIELRLAGHVTATVPVHVEQALVIDAHLESLEEAEEPIETPLVESLPEGEAVDIEDFDLEAMLRGEMVVSASRTAERAQDAPASVTVITREQLMVWGYTTVAEVLERVVGFYTIDDHMIPNVAVRGISGGLRAESGLLKVMVDGRPVSFRPTGGNWLGAELIPLTAVERIEIIRGPASVVYGADAFLGVINVVTREASRVDGGEVWAAGNYAGGFGGDLDMTIGGRHESVSAMLALRLRREDRSGLQLPASSPEPSLRPTVDRNARAQRLYLDSGSIFSRITYHIDDNNTVAITGLASLLERSGEFAGWLQLGNGLDDAGRTRGTVISLVRGFGDLSANLHLSDEVDLRLNAGYFGGAPTDRERIDVGSDIAYVRREMSSDAGQAEASLEWRPLSELQLVGGADFLYDHQTLPGSLQILFADAGGLRAGDVREDTSTRQGERDFINVGVFLLGNWSPVEILRINAGIRFDYNNIYDFQLNGRLGASLRVIDELTIKVNYNSAFRAPTTQLLYGTPLFPGDILGNPGLRPQQLHTVEAGLALSPEDWLRVESGVSFNYGTGIATFVQSGLDSEARNVDEIGVVAWETEARVAWEDQLWAYANVAVVGGFRSTSEVGYRADLVSSDLPGYPPVAFNVGLAYRFTDFPLRLGAEGRFIGDRRASDGNVLAAGAPYTLPATFYLDAQIGFADVALLGDRLTSLLFVVRNVLDNRDAHPGFSGIDYPSAPRSFMLQLRQQL